MVTSPTNVQSRGHSTCNLWYYESACSIGLPSSPIRITKRIQFSYLTSLPPSNVSSPGSNSHRVSPFQRLGMLQLSCWHHIRTLSTIRRSSVHVCCCNSIHSESIFLHSGKKYNIKYAWPNIEKLIKRKIFENVTVWCSILIKVDLFAKFMQIGNLAWNLEFYPYIWTGHLR